MTSARMGCIVVSSALVVGGCAAGAGVQSTEAAPPAVATVEVPYAAGGAPVAAPVDVPSGAGGAPAAAGPAGVTESVSGAGPAPAAGEAKGAAAPMGLVPGGLARGTGEAADKELVLADRAYREGDLTTAQAKYRAAQKLAPKDPAARVGLARVNFARGTFPTEYGGAPRDARVGALLAEVDSILRGHADYGPAHVERGRLLLVQGDGPRALAALERGAALSPDDPEAQSALGIALLATGDAEGALERLRRASTADPESAERLTNLGTALLMRGRVAEAILAFRRAVDLTPEDPVALSDLGTAYLSANRVKDAKPFLERAATLAPDRATFLSNLGYAQHQLQDLAGALSTFERALSKDPKLVSAWLNKGNVLVDLGKLDEAEAAFKKALSLDPTDPRAQASLSDLAELRKTPGARAPASR